MSNLRKLRERNAGVEILGTESDRFRKYGRRIAANGLTSLLTYAFSVVVIPESGNVYIPSVPDLERLSGIEEIRDSIYGQMPIQAGSCAGQNSVLNGFEYHQGSETIGAITDCVLILGLLYDMHSWTYDLSLVEYFFLNGGEAVELYSTTLHYTPCKVSGKGFATVCILPRGTNEPCAKSGNVFVTKRNKFFMTHESQAEKVAAGVFPGLKGTLPRIVPLD